MRHTPGPWAVQHHGDNEGDIHGSDGTLVCMMREGDTAPEDDWSADARLIASAPDLLDTLRLANDALDYAQAQVDSESDRERLRHWRTRVQNVIALAEGR